MKTGMRDREVNGRENRVHGMAWLGIVALTLSLSGCATYLADKDRWNSAKLGDSVESYEDYLQRFPEGMHAQEAKLALNAAQAKREVWFPQEWGKVRKLVPARTETNVAPLLDMLAFANSYSQHPEAQETLKKVVAFFQEGNTPSPKSTQVGSISLDGMGETMLTVAGGDGAPVTLQRRAYPKIGVTLLRVKYGDRDLSHNPNLVELGLDNQYWTLMRRAGKLEPLKTAVPQAKEAGK